MAGQGRFNERLQRFFFGLLSAFEHAPDSAQRAASALLLATLYPERLTIVAAAWADEVAAGPTFGKKLGLPEVSRALDTLAAAVPALDAAAQAVVTSAAALGTALDDIDRLLVDEAGKTASELFAERVQAHKQLAIFAQVVQGLAYPSDAPEDKAARTALIGPYLRYLAAVPGGRGTAATTDGAAPADTAEADAG